MNTPDLPRYRLPRHWLSRYWLLVPLLLIAVIALDWAERPATFESEETLDMRATEADYYLEDFTTRRFDANGTLEYLVSGRALSHYPDDNRSEVEAPRVELHHPGVIWRARADRGRLDTNPDIFTLNGDVRLERAVGAAPPADTAPDTTVTILTDVLSVGIDADEVSTDAPIAIIADGWRLSGTGLRSNRETGKLILLSDVNGTYDAVPSD